jgi:hypothetical protein
MTRGTASSSAAGAVLRGGLAAALRFAARVAVGRGGFATFGALGAFGALVAFVAFAAFAAFAVDFGPLRFTADAAGFVALALAGRAFSGRTLALDAAARAGFAG